MNALSVEIDIGLKRYGSTSKSVLAVIVTMFQYQQTSPTNRRNEGSPMRLWQIDELSYHEGGTMLNMEPPSVPKKDEDSYGSVLRAGLKRSMEKPSDYKKLNVREPQTVSPWVLVLFMASTIVSGVALFYGFNFIESFFRP